MQAVWRVSLRTNALLRKKPWKRELDQFSVLDSCTSFSMDDTYLVSISQVLGVPLEKPSKKKGQSVALSQEIKTAVVQSLQTNGQRLSNGIFALRRNGIHDKISWACTLKNDSETLMVWHIATSICEMNPSSSSSSRNQALIQGFEVATKLSKYCAYLLAFAPLLVSISVMEAQVIGEEVVKEARALLKKPFSVCGNAGEAKNYDKLMELLAEDEEARGGGQGIATSTLKKGVKLGLFFNSIVGDETRWKILGEFWTEFIMFLAPSNNNAIAHVGKLADGGEFIAHLWALLIHASILDRNLRRHKHIVP